MISVFLPCRSGSKRVPKKNTRTFAGREDGLIGIKIEQLSKAKLINRIIVSTDDEVVIECIEKLRVKIDNLELDRRPKHLALDTTSTDELISYVPDVIKEGHVLWTHVTSPFIKKKTIFLLSFHIDLVKLKTQLLLIYL